MLSGLFPFPSLAIAVTATRCRGGNCLTWIPAVETLLEVSPAFDDKIVAYLGPHPDKDTEEMEPLVEPALEKAARLGFSKIVVFPYFLFTGILVDRIQQGLQQIISSRVCLRQELCGTRSRIGSIHEITLRSGSIRDRRPW